MAAFLPKYLESQFNLTPGYASILIGLVIVPAAAGGSLIGGFIVKYYRLSRTQSIMMYIVCQIVILPLYAGFLFHCPNQNFAGVYPISSESTTTKLLLTPSSSSSSSSLLCGVSECNCSISSFKPMCGSDGITYYNPCFAGCWSGNGTLFANCSCVGDDRNLGKIGLCDNNCDFIPFIILIFFQIFFTLMATMPGLVASLRSVEPLHRSLSLGLQTILVRGLGTVPGPIVFGYILDSSCLLWQEDECRNNDNLGNCLIYDNFVMSRYIMGVLVIWRAVGAFFFGGALYYSRKSKIQES